MAARGLRSPRTEPHASRGPSGRRLADTGSLTLTEMMKADDVIYATLPPKNLESGDPQKDQFHKTYKGATQLLQEATRSKRRGRRTAWLACPWSAGGTEALSAYVLHVLVPLCCFLRHSADPLPPAAGSWPTSSRARGLKHLPTEIRAQTRKYSSPPHFKTENAGTIRTLLGTPITVFMIFLDQSGSLLRGSTVPY